MLWKKLIFVLKKINNKKNKQNLPYEQDYNVEKIYK